VATRRLIRAHMLLQAAAGATQDASAAALHLGRATVVRICKRCVEEGREAALQDRPRPGGATPAGWHARGLPHRRGMQHSGRAVDMLDDAVAGGQAGRTPGGGRRQRWCLPTLGADFVWRMEDILERESGRCTIRIPKLKNSLMP
jgi:hypothetical protein